MNFVSIFLVTVLSTICLFVFSTQFLFSIHLPTLVAYLGPSPTQQVQTSSNQSFVSYLAGNNTIPEVITNTTGTARFLINPFLQSINEIYYEINLTNVQSDISKVDLRYGNKTTDGPAIAVLYQRTLSIPIDVCCKSVEADQNRDKFFFNGTITIPSLQFGSLYNAKNIGELVKMFNNNSAYVEVYTLDPDSNSLFGIKDELRGQIAAANLG